MSDVRLALEAGAADLRLVNSDLEADDGLYSAVVISLFTDRRAEVGDTPASAEDRRGWWADAYADVEGDRIGSRLWLLSREKQTGQALLRARDYAREALLWLVEDGVARAINVTAELLRDGVLVLTVEIVRAEKPVTKYRFEAFWRGT